MPSIYDRIGGEPALTAVVDDFYRRVCADAELTEFFVGIDLDRVKQHQIDYFSTVLGGPAVYTGAPIRRIHQGLGITRRHFDRVVGHFAAALAAAGVPTDIAYRTLEALTALADDIVTPRPRRSAPRRNGSRIWVWSSTFGATSGR